MRFSEDFLSELRYRNRIEEIVGGYVNLKNAGSTLKGLCPFHNEKTPSLTVYPASNSYYCFGCGSGGDVITFVRNAENLDYIEAVKYLSDRAGLNMPDDSYDDSAEKLRRTVYAINRETARFYAEFLKNDPNKTGLKYFKGRQLSDKTIIRFGLGYAPDSWTALCDHLRKKGFHDEEMVIANVAVRGRNGKVYDRFRKKYMFPIIDLRGNVIAFGGRKHPEDEGGKYLNTNDTPVYKKSKNLFGMNFAKNSKSDKFILCEGYMDAIALHQAGFDFAVAACGTAFTEEQARLLSRYCNEVVITMDADEAGQRAADRAAQILRKAGMKLSILQIEGGKDPDEYIKTYGADKFKYLLNGAKSELDFKLLKLQNKYDLKLDAERLEYLNEAVNILANIDDDIAIDIYAGRISAECKIEKSTFIARIKKTRTDRKNFNHKRALKEIAQPPRKFDNINPEEREHRRAAAAEKTILAILMHDSYLYDSVKDILSPDDFVTSFHKRIYTFISSLLDRTQSFDITMLSGDFSPEEMGRIVQIGTSSSMHKNSQQEITDCIEVLKQEKAKSSKIDTNNMDDDDFASLINKIGKDKK